MRASDTPRRRFHENIALKGEPMAQSVAFAKTTRPAIGSIVPRARLFARLDGAPGRAVAWISFWDSTTVAGPWNS